MVLGLEELHAGPRLRGRRRRRPARPCLRGPRPRPRRRRRLPAGGARGVLVSRGRRSPRLEEQRLRERPSGQARERRTRTGGCGGGSGSGLRGLSPSSAPCPAPPLAQLPAPPPSVAPPRLQPGSSPSLSPPRVSFSFPCPFPPFPAALQLLPGFSSWLLSQALPPCSPPPPALLRLS